MFSDVLAADIETAWIEQARRGDMEAFNQLVLAYQDLLFQYVYSMLDDPDSAADVVQDSLIKAYQNLASYRGGSLRAWLLRIASNQALDWLRRQRRRPACSLQWEDEQGEEMETPGWMIDPALPVHDIIELKEREEYISAVLNRLPAVYRSAILLVDLLELDYREAADALSVPVGTLKSRLARARLRAREMLDVASQQDWAYALTPEPGI